MSDGDRPVHCVFARVTEPMMLTDEQTHAMMGPRNSSVSLSSTESANLFGGRLDFPSGVILTSTPQGLTVTFIWPESYERTVNA